MSTPSWKLDTCVFGHGIVCGLEVHVDDKCNVHISPGTAVTISGAIFHLHEAKRFQNYFKKLPDLTVKGYFDNYNKYHNFLFWELAEGTYDSNTMDSLKAQYKSDNDPQAADEGHGTFLNDKILVLYIDESKAHPLLRFLLFRDDDVARLCNIEGEVANLMAADKSFAGKTGLFAKNKKRNIDFDPEKMDMVVRKQMQLPELPVLRLGYKNLALFDDKYPIDRDDPPAGKELLDNLRNPYGAITSFEDLFLEYKSILDKSIPQLYEAISKLHLHFGSLLTHRDEKYLERYRTALTRKWWAFKYGGEHLYYIQYFYDWVLDMGKAYRELRDAIDDFSAHCLCAEPCDDQAKHTHMLLGPVMGGRSSYKPLIFRDYFKQPFTANNNEERLREIKCLHWRLMMMIWTFDLPFLHLEQKKYVPSVKPELGAELKDSTDYWENIDSNLDESYDLEDVPVKITPGYPLDFPLGRWSIPYYYPLDSDSPYSVHRFWDFHTTKMNRINKLLSFNANHGTDSYSRLCQVLTPLAYNLREYSFFRVEGLVGKKIRAAGDSYDYAPAITRLLETINKYNLCIDVLAVDIAWYGVSGSREISGLVTDLLGMPQVGVSIASKGAATAATTDVEGRYSINVDSGAVLVFSYTGFATVEASIGLETTIDVMLPEFQPPPNDVIKVGPYYPRPLSKLLGLDRIGGVQQGQTLVILYTSKDEQIELSECRKDITPEINAYTIVGDMTLPFRYTCCEKPSGAIKLYRQNMNGHIPVSDDAQKAEKALKTLGRKAAIAKPSSEKK